MAKDARAVIELMNRRREEDLAARGKAEPKPAAPTVARHRQGPAGRSRINFNAPADLARQFKSKAAREGESMTEVLLRLMTEYVNE